MQGRNVIFLQSELRFWESASGLLQVRQPMAFAAQFLIDRTLERHGARLSMQHRPRTGTHRDATAIQHEAQVTPRKEPTPGWAELSVHMSQSQ
jgi:hypothetical protein